MAKVLFLDDDRERQKVFKREMIGHNVIVVETPEEAFEVLDRHSRFDIASLDHDLFGQVFQPSDEKSGFAVCEYIDEMPDEDKPEKIICHSYNDEGVATMMALLVTAIAAPFNSDEYWMYFPRTRAVE